MAANTSTKVRKNSIANPSVGGSGGVGSANARPRASTISHLESSLFPAGNQSAKGSGSSASHGADVNQIAHGSSTRAVNATNPLIPTRLLTQGLALTLGGLRTAPPRADGFTFDQYFGQNSTINPAQLHVDEAIKSAPAPFMHQFAGGLPTSTSTMDDDEGFDWMRGFSSQMNFGTGYDHAIGEGSPSVMSAVSHVGFGDASMDARKASVQSIGFGWQTGSNPQPLCNVTPFALEDGMSSFPGFIHPSEVMSPKHLNGHFAALETIYPTTSHVSSFSPTSALNTQGVQAPFNHLPTFSSEVSSDSSGSINGASRHSSATSVSSCAITDTTRQALLLNLQPSLLGRKTSQPHLSSPLSPQLGQGQVSLPSTGDLQRYVNAYITYFHPHLPFLHIPTLSFDSPVYTASIRHVNGFPGFGEASLIGGGGCLILAMAAIGALYEFERATSKELFDNARWLIRIYLEERRNTPTTTADGGAAQDTPLWLVQAMLLNVIYGHNCGDKLSSDIASTHCAALVSLARAADLTKPLPDGRSPASHRDNYVSSSGDVHMSGDLEYHDAWTGAQSYAENEADWHRWIDMEERKRTLFAIFHLSSLLVSAYNHAPALMNSEVQLDLPCDEDLWSAESARIWTCAGGAFGANQKAIPFANALSNLLEADLRLQQGQQYARSSFGYEIPIASSPLSDMRPSTFGCLVLINALHNYIWETRQRHSGRQWTTQQTDAMHAHIEPALRAWQAAWAANPAHRLERPNPYGPLSADSIPLLDLAYVRLFVNLGQSKEAFWQRDFDAMAEELARGSEIVQHAESNNDDSDRDTGSASSKSSKDSHTNPNQDETPSMRHAREQQKLKTKREHHLRKAAHYAADSLSMSDKLGVTFADFTSRELPVQSAMCAFDCAQVLAEWIATVQERVGRYLGIVGRDDIDYGQVPAIMLLQDEDCKLLEKIASILQKAEEKMAHGNGVAVSSLASLSNAGYGSKVLVVTAYMLERAAVWPGWFLPTSTTESPANSW